MTNNKGGLRSLSLQNKRSKIPIINQSYMNEQNQHSLHVKRKKKLLIRRLTVFFIFAGIITFISAKTLHSQSKLMEAKQEQLDALQKEYKNIEKQQSILQDEIIKLQDDEYIGKYARQEFFLSDDGEIIFSIPNEEEQEDTD